MKGMKATVEPKMSSIFQNRFGDSNEGSSAEESYDEAINPGKQNGRAVAVDVAQENVTSNPVSGALARLGGHRLPDLETKQHSTLFYLSLIEGRCRTQAANSINKDRGLFDQLPENHPEVLDLARHLFAEISKELHTAGILPDEFAGQNLEKLRSQYLNSFDAILHNIASRQAHELNTFKSITGSDEFSASRNTTPFLAFPNALARQQHFTMAPNTTELPSGLYSFMLKGSAGSLGRSTRSIYQTKFKEIELLGRGGFGGVYKAHHHMDNHDYAIKKIRIPADDLPMPNEPDGVAKLLSELRILADLNHHNVVRYHDGWAESVSNDVYRAAIEQGGSSSFITGTIGSRSLQEADDFASQLRDLTIDRGSRRIDDEDDFDPFEREPSAMPEEPLKSTCDSKDASQSIGASQQALTIPFRSRFFGISGSTSVDEEIERSKSTPIESSLKSDVILYIQMALHPMTLEDYIWGSKSPGNAKVLHCFHTAICVQILLSILDGIEYIHSKRIVHRDLKPSNIFLSVTQGPSSDFEGLIDITGCGDCEVDTPNIRTFITPHIGDFGLAAEMKAGQLGTPRTKGLLAKPMALAMVSTQQTSSFRQPGTKYYCPPPSTDHTICPKLDVYSLGVIAFELVTKFATKSERHVVLDQLCKGIFHEDFDTHELATGIKGMLCSKREERWSCGQVRKWLRSIQSKYERV